MTDASSACANTNLPTLMSAEKIADAMVRSVQ